MLLLVLLGCTNAGHTDTAPEVWTTQVIEGSEQRPGDAEQGWDTLRYGDFVGAGVPAEVWFSLVPELEDNALEREGDSAFLPPSFNLFEAPNGVEVVGGITCFGCHASYLDGEFVPGLGNAFSSYQSDESANYGLIGAMVASGYGEDSPEYAAYEPLGLGAAAVSPALVMPFAGVNPAFPLEMAAVRHRDPDTLAWVEEPSFALPDVLPGADVPPWWRVQKKAALYSNGMGRGDFSRLLMQTSVVAVGSTEHADAIDAQFPDVLAWLMALEPPAYPGDIDADLAELGEEVFLDSCSGCHGTYAADPAEETYPNLLVHVDEVGTDPVYAETLAYEPFVDWMRSSWFGQSGDHGEFVAELAYLAPPLDGIWATAPFLHNGSVPDLVSLLDPDERPTTWRRDFEDSTYDHDRVGWPWSAGDESFATYDTTIEAYGNQGHTYGADLTAEERDAVLEYLKTL